MVVGCCVFFFRLIVRNTPQRRSARNKFNVYIWIMHQMMLGQVFWCYLFTFLFSVCLSLDGVSVCVFFSIFSSDHLLFRFSRPLILLLFLLTLLLVAVLVGWKWMTPKQVERFMNESTDIGINFGLDECSLSTVQVTFFPLSLSRRSLFWYRCVHLHNSNNILITSHIRCRRSTRTISMRLCRRTVQFRKEWSEWTTKKNR